MATPLDQISRLGHVRVVDGMEVDYYSVDTREDKLTFQSVMPTEESTDDLPIFKCNGTGGATFEVTESFAYKRNDGSIGTGYVMARGDNALTVVVQDKEFDSVCASNELIRMGRAATQLDVQTPQFAVLPKKMTNYCQIFKMQIEQSLVMKLSHKEIGWDFTDQQEAAIYDMRLGMEKQFLFGTKMKFYDSVKGENVLLTEGIWNQAGKDIEVKLDTFNSKGLVDMLRQAFTENSGSRRKILLAGSDLIAAINKLDSERVITARDQVTSWGIDFSELCSKFGKLYVVFSDIFDRMGMSGNGLIVDPEYIQKHVFMPFSAEKLDLHGSGQRNTEAMVLTEASCLTLRYPEAHARIIGK
jgi:hypothetical protein